MAVEQTTLLEELVPAEGLLVQERDEEARDVLLRLAEDVEEYVDRNCPTTEDVQWFSFPTIFERLCYRRVEDDPRELRDVGSPLIACMQTSRWRTCALGNTTMP